MAINIGHAASDERKKVKGGQAGDQSGSEVCIRKWYDGGWQFVIRFTDPKMAEIAAKTCEAGCKNKAIGYDQSQRNNLYYRAKEVNYDLSKIKTKCECDCSAFMCVCAMAAGVNPKYLYIDGVLRRTKNMRAAFKKIPGVKILTAKKYLTSDKYLKRGDILVREHKHTVMALANGSKVQTDLLKKPSKVVKPFTPYLVRVQVSALNIRKGPGAKYGIMGTIKNKGVYTIVKEQTNGSTKWGLLKAGIEEENMWIALKYTKKV